MTGYTSKGCNSIDINDLSIRECANVILLECPGSLIHRYSDYCSKCINIPFTNRILHKLILVTHNFKIEERRKQVATLLAQSMTETEIAYELKVEVIRGEITKY
jgi:DNA-binding NarL/FixJ family response regulator